MAVTSLAVKYRPNTFKDLCEQKSIISILTNQIETKTFQHAYLFIGPAGTGKTTSARIFADMINNGEGVPIEIDAASNSGVEDIRKVIRDSKKKSLDSDYKIFIIDECHSLSNSAWQALLKLLEESPKYSIFILCTTNPEKIPATIMSRVQQFKFNRISKKGIENRLLEICKREKEKSNNITVTDEAIDYIAKLANGGMRMAITMLDKCLSLSSNVDLDSVLTTLGTADYETFFFFTEQLINKDRRCIATINDLYNEGKDLKQFNSEYLKFLLDVMSYLIFKNLDNTDFPEDEKIITELDNFQDKDNIIMDIIKVVKEINSKARYSTDLKTLSNISYLLYCGE